MISDAAEDKKKSKIAQKNVKDLSVKQTTGLVQGGNECSNKSTQLINHVRSLLTSE